MGHPRPPRSATTSRPAPAQANRDGPVRDRDLAPYPFAVAASATDVWVASGNTGTLTHVDPSLGTIAATVHIGFNLTRPAAAPTGAWIADSDAGVIYRIDARTNAVTRKITLNGPGTPVDLAYDGGDVWVALA